MEAAQLITTKFLSTDTNQNHIFPIFVCTYTLVKYAKLLLIKLPKLPFVYQTTVGR